MQREIIFDKIESYIQNLQDNNITKVAIATIDEKRPDQIEPNVLQVVHMKKIELLAYKDSIVYKCIIENRSPGDIEEILSPEGFEIIHRNRNIS